MPPKRARKTVSKKLPFQENPIVRRKETLVWKLENMTSGRRACSELYAFGNLTWKIEIKREMGQKLKIFMILNSCQTNGRAWLCPTVFRPRLFLKKGENREYFVEQPSQSYTFGGFQSLDPESLSTCFNNIEIKDILKMEIALEFDMYDFNSPVSSNPAVELKVDNTSFYFDKYTLACLSQYFYIAIVIEEKEEVVMNNVRKEELTYFLAAICSIGLDLTEQNHICIVKLASRFNVEPLFEKCETWITENSTLPIWKKIKVADWYGLPTILNNISDLFNTLDEVREVTQWGGFRRLEITTQKSVWKSMEKFSTNTL